MSQRSGHGANGGLVGHHPLGLDHQAEILAYEDEGAVLPRSTSEVLALNLDGIRSTLLQRLAVFVHHGLVVQVPRVTQTHYSATRAAAQLGRNVIGKARRSASPAPSGSASPKGSNTVCETVDFR